MAEVHLRRIVFAEEVIHQFFAVGFAALEGKHPLAFADEVVPQCLHDNDGTSVMMPLV